MTFAIFAIFFTKFFCSTKGAGLAEILEFHVYGIVATLILNLDLEHLWLLPVCS